jgi:hypothetical protein
MNNILKASPIFLAGMLSSSIAGFIYGWVGYNFDLFLVFPWVVTLFIVGISSYAAKVLLYNERKSLFIMGIIFGVVAYSVYVYGGYIAFSGAVQQQILQVPQNRNMLSTDLSIFTKQAINEILQRTVGITGIIGWLLFKMNASISPFYASNSNQGQGSYVAGFLVELYKLGCMTIVTGIALRDYTGTLINLEKDEAYQEIIKRQRQEQQAQRQANTKEFRIVVAVTLIIFLVPLLFLIISLYLYG